VSALQGICRRHAEDYEFVRKAIEATYNCRRVTGWRRLATLTSDPMGIGQTACPADLVVVAAKWLFVEQDVTYWHNSGRAMTYAYLQDEGVV
jgi:hypothetical protein